MSLVINKAKYRVKPLAPFRLDLTVWVLRREPANITDRWEGSTYRRALVWAGHPIEVSAAQGGSPDDPWVEVTALGDLPGHELKAAAVAALERLLGLRVDLAGFYRLAERDKRLAALADRFRGVKPPRFPTIFETLVNAIACQQITLAAGINMLNRLNRAFGLELPSGYAFPRPVDLAGLDVASLGELGFSIQKARAIIELAQAVSGVLDLEQLRELDDEDALSILYQLRGVGWWTGDYVLLRGLGRLHIFPRDDVGARHRVRRWLELPDEPDSTRVREMLAPWKPYAGFIYYHLLLAHQAEKGYIE